MNPIIVNNPADIGWQTNLFDVAMVVMFLSALGYAVAQWRRGTRIYATLLVAAFLYGVVLELGGMATLNMYTQGKFTVMLNFPALKLFAGTTAMPSYVLIFYPVFLFVGFKVIEALGITKKWQAAITGGLFMIALDAPYIIEGGLRHVVWWTWHTHFEMFQFWLGWPLVDLCWQATWDAMFFYLMLRALPHVDGVVSSRWANVKCLGLFAPLTALIVIASGSLLLLPLTVVTFLHGPQWPVVIGLVLTYLVIVATALRTAIPRRRRPEPITGWVVGVYIAALAAMVVANLWHEGGLTLYAVVQAVGLAVVCALTLFPAFASRAKPPGETIPFSALVLSSVGAAQVPERRSAK